MQPWIGFWAPTTFISSCSKFWESIIFKLLEDAPKFYHKIACDRLLIRQFHVTFSNQSFDWSLASLVWEGSLKGLMILNKHVFRWLTLLGKQLACDEYRLKIVLVCKNWAYGFNTFNDSVLSSLDMEAEGGKSF